MKSMKKNGIFLAFVLVFLFLSFPVLEKEQNNLFAIGESERKTESIEERNIKNREVVEERNIKERTGETERIKISSLEGASNEKRKDMQQKREEFQKKTQTIRDEKKKEIVQKIEERMNALNQWAVEAMENRLERMEDLIAKIEKRVEKIVNDGGKTTEVNMQVVQIKSTITNIRTQLTNQKEKLYTPTISTEDKLKLDVGQTYQKLESDLKSIRTLIINLKQDLAKTLKMLGQINTKKLDAQ